MFRPELPPFASCFKSNLAPKRRILVQRENAEQHRETRKKRKKTKWKRSVHSGPQFFRSKHPVEALHVVNRVDFVPFKLFSGSFKKRTRVANNVFYTKKNRKKQKKKRQKKQKKTEKNRNGKTNPLSHSPRRHPGDAKLLRRHSQIIAGRSYRKEKK